MGEMVLVLVCIVDDFLGVFVYVVYNGDVMVIVSDGIVVVFVVDGDEFIWIGDFVVGQCVMIIYLVIVCGDVGGVIIVNIVEGMVMFLGGVEFILLLVMMENFVGILGFMFVKIFDLVFGIVVVMGSVVIYIFIGINIGEMGLDEVVVMDDLVGVLWYVDF